MHELYGFLASIFRINYLRGH